MATRDLISGLEVKVLVLQPGVDGQPLKIPDAHFLFTADFDRSGNDLVMSNESGQTIIVEGYFAGDSPVDLASPDGALLRASVVESLAGPLAPGQYAQTGAPDGKAPIGQVETLEGTATAQRTDGTTVQLKIGDPVFQGDVVATSGASKIGITFIDNTVFSLSEDARMVLDELVYSPGGSDNSMLVNIVQGTFVFIAGEVAPTGDMKVQTPVATMGIRGTTVISKMSAIDGTLVTSLDIDPDGGKGAYQIIDTVTNEVLATIAVSGENWIITPSGVPGAPPTVTTLPKSDSELVQDQEALAFIYQTYNAARARFGTDTNNNDGNTNNDGSSNGSTSSGIESDVDDTETEPLDQNGAPTDPESGNPSGGPEEPAGPPQGLPEGSNDQSQAPPSQPPAQPPSSAGVLVVTDEDTPSEGISIPVTPNNPDDIIFISITELPPKGLLLFNGEPVEQNELIPAESTEDLTFSPNGEFEELNSTDVEPLQFLYTVSDQNGVTSEPVVGVISVPGVNDVPVAVDDVVSAPETGSENTVLLIDVLANDTDPDRDDDPTNFNLTDANIESETGGTVAIVNNKLQFDPGTDFDYLNVGDSVEVEVGYTMTDDEGAPSSASVFITVTGQNDLPAALDSTIETTADTPATGQLSVFDPDDNETASFEVGPNGPQHGTVVIQPDGAFTYTPDPVPDAPPFQGFDEFEFIVTDGAGETSTGTVTVEVANGSFESEGGQTISFGLNGEAPLTSSNPALNGIGIGNLEVNLTEVSGTEINVSFVFDASGSLGSADYNTQLDAVQKAVDDVRAQFEDSQTVVNFQFVRFASGVTTAEYVFDPSIDPQNDTQTFDIDNIKGELPFTGGGTNFDAGLAAAESFFNANSGADQSFLFFSSDGNPSNFSNPPQWVVTAGALHAAGIIVSAFGIGPFISPANLDIIDNTGGSENVATVNDLSEAFSGTPIFAAELVSLSLNLVADGVNQGEIATEADLTPDGINSDLLLANIPNIGDLLGEENQFTATATFDFDNDLATTDDQITLVSLETISASDTAVTKTGTSGDDLLLGGVQADDIAGAGGADVILGFAGNDKLTVSDATFQKVDGGLGQDTLVLDNTDLDLSTLSNTKYSSIETIDLQQTGASTLTLNLAAVQGLSETVNEELDAILEGLLGAGNAPADNLVVDGAATDTVNLVSEGGGSWIFLSETAFDDYDIYAFQDTGGAILAAVALDDDIPDPLGTA